jgi:hypothetical protein
MLLLLLSLNYEIKTNITHSLISKYIHKFDNQISYPITFTIPILFNSMESLIINKRKIRIWHIKNIQKGK